MVGVKLEIQDTGVSSVGGAKIYSTSSDDWINLYATTMRPELDSVGTNHESARIKDGERVAVSNEIITSLPTRITINGLYLLSDIENFKKVIKMQRTLGLKKIKGGLGLINILPGVTDDSEIYIIIRSIKPTEVMSDSTSTIGYTMQVEVVEE